MKAVGLVTEYNPFHNGHLYHLNKAMELTGADISVAVMSGDFVQRGEPAVLDKYTRTSMALNSGVNLVVELPVNYAVSSAESFAAGALKVLDYVKADSIAFGCVCIQDFRQLQPPRGSVAAIICHRTFAGNGQGVGLHLFAVFVFFIVEAPGCVVCHTVQGIVILCQLPRDIITLCAASAGCFSRIG